MGGGTDDWDGWGDDVVSTPAPATGGYSGGGGRGGGGGGGPRTCNKCNEEGHMARDCPQGGGGGGGGPRTCHKCNEEGHMARDCPQGGGGGGGGGPRTCRKCNEEGHIARECPQGGGGGGGPRTCHKCNEEGHMARDCPQGGGGGPRTCRKCNEEGHIARECPQGGEEGGEGRLNGVGGATGCRRCGQEGHFAKECTNEPVEGAEKKERYNAPDLPEGDAVFADHAESHSGSGINFSKYDSIAFKVEGENHPAGVKEFSDLGLRPLILENIAKCGYTHPTPIQQHASPCLMAGRDVMACAQTGSGKTAGYLLPIIHALMTDPELTPSGAQPATPEALIVAPTRELALQIGKEANVYASQSIVRSKVLYGGTTLFSTRNQLQSGVNIMVATPGRLNQLLSEGQVSLAKTKFFILDEADRMLDMGFMPDIQKIMDKLPPKENRVSGMFSATFPEEIQQTAKALLKPDYVFVTIGLVGGACADVAQEFRQVERKGKRDALMEFLKNEISKDDKIIVFCGSKKNADFIATVLSTRMTELSATSIHGDRLQAQREQALREFTTGKRQVLVATAVAARGLDIPKVSIVINYDMPQEIDEYVHRIGRTGRVGNTGKAISFFDGENENDSKLAPRLVYILETSGQEVPEWLKAYGSESVDMGNGVDMSSGGGGADEDDGW